MSARFSDTEAEQIDVARGDTNRSEWLRSIALASLAARSQEPQRRRSGKTAKAGRESESAEDIAAFYRRRTGGQ
jgi:hypothetical protein